MKKIFLLLVVLFYQNNNGHTKLSKTYLGAGINIFKFFGDLSMRIRTTPRNDSGLLWLFRDPLAYVFNLEPNSVNLKNGTKMALKIELCDDLTALYSAYFRGIKIEGLENGWKGFTKSWTSITAARKFGMSESYSRHNFSYLLVTMDWFVEQGNFNHSKINGIKMTETANNYKSQLNVDDPTSLNKFINIIGSHYISSYVSGEGLYQVYIFQQKAYNDLKHMMKSRTINREEIVNFFTSLYSNSVGKLMVRSGDQTLTKWIRGKFQAYHLGTPSRSKYPSHLLEIYKRSHLISEITNRLRTQVIMKLKLSLIHNVFSEEKIKVWFKEIIDNRLKLYEMNI